MKDLIQQETLAIKARLSNMNRGRNKQTDKSGEKCRNATVKNNYTSYLLASM